MRSLFTRSARAAQAAGHAPPWPPAGLAGEPRRIDAVTLLTWYVFLLMAIPSSLIIGSFGAAGPPACLFAAVLLGWYLAARHHPAFGVERGHQPVRVAAVIFGCVIVASYVSANRAAMPALEVNAADRGLILLAGWLGVLLLAADGIDQADRLAVLLRRIVLGAAAVAALGLVEFATGSSLAQYIRVPGLTVHAAVTDLISRNGQVRVTGTTAQPLELASVLAMSLPLAIHQARFAAPAAAKRRWLQVAVIAAVLPLTGSRSAFLAVAVIGVVLLPTWPRSQRRLTYLVLVAVPAVAWLVSPGLLHSFGVLFGQIGSDQSTRSRTGAFSAAAPFIAQHPWLGRGFQTFFPQTYFFVDDQYLLSLIEIGVVGALAQVGLFATGWFTARRARRAAADARTRDLAQCLAASVAAGAVSFASFDALSFSTASGLYFLLLGCTGAACRLAGGQQLAGIQRPATAASRAGGRAGWPFIEVTKNYQK